MASMCSRTKPTRSTHFRPGKGQQIQGVWYRESRSGFSNSFQSLPVYNSSRISAEKINFWPIIWGSKVRAFQLEWSLVAVTITLILTNHYPQGYGTRVYKKKAGSCRFGQKLSKYIQRYLYMHCSPCTTINNKNVEKLKNCYSYNSPLPVLVTVNL